MLSPDSIHVLPIKGWVARRYSPLRSVDSFSSGGGAEQEEMALGGAWRSSKPYLLMVFLQVGFAGMFIISVASFKRGMNHYVLAVLYRNGIATAVIAPFALWFEGFVPRFLYIYPTQLCSSGLPLYYRKSRPNMSLSVFLKIMALALLKYVGAGHLTLNLILILIKNSNLSLVSNIRGSANLYKNILVGPWDQTR